MIGGVLAAVRRVGTNLALVRWTVAARLRGIKLSARVHPDARISLGAKLELVRGPGSTVLVELAEGVRIEAGSLVRVTGGASIELGPDAVIRRFAVLNIAGRLVMEGENLLSWHSVLHCAEQVVFERKAGTGEGVTVVDGRHYRRDPDDHWYQNSATAPVNIGANVWLASHSTVGPGVTIGPATTVAAGSVVLSDVPGNALVAGAPARVVRTQINAGEQQRLRGGMR